LPNISKQHHFYFSSKHPDSVKYSEWAHTMMFSHEFLKADFPKTLELPPVMTPKGLNDERKEYLYKEVRKFCKPGTKDLVAPFFEIEKQPKKKKGKNN